jgi:hypothetical protein
MYRIYTEDLNREQIEAIIGKSFDSFTVLPAVGYWHGHKENSLVIEVDTDDKLSVVAAASRIKEQNHQEAVLVTEVNESRMLV